MKAVQSFSRTPVTPPPHTRPPAALPRTVYVAQHSRCCPPGTTSTRSVQENLMFAVDVRRNTINHCRSATPINERGRVRNRKGQTERGREDALTQIGRKVGRGRKRKKKKEGTRVGEGEETAIGKGQRPTLRLHLASQTACVHVFQWWRSARLRNKLMYVTPCV